jgi:ABC-2 type transport system ATP-binding protein
MFKDYDQTMADQMIELLGLNMMEKIRNLSKGMQERVLLGMTLSRKARLYLLDEPLGGIDPIGKSKVVDAIIAMELGEASLLVSTHLLRDIERIFDTIHLLGNGRILFEADCDTMRAESGKTVEQVYLEVFGYA